MYETPTHDERTLEAAVAKAPFGYYGAKLRLAKRIVSMLPPHNAWVEGFCGSAALTLAKPPAPIEVINDLDGEVVNLFEQLRCNADELCRAVALTPYARQEFAAARSERDDNGDDNDSLERARRFLVSTMMTVNGTIGSGRSGFSFSQSYAREGREARVNRWYNLPDRLANVVERLRGVRVENRDARELLEMFADRPATLVYLDPPYFTRRDHRYVVDANYEEFHEELLTKCSDANCMLLISGYETELYNAILSEERGWTREIVLAQTRDTSGKDYERSEVLWMNPLFRQARESGRVLIELTEAERAERKVNPPRSGRNGTQKG